LKDTVEKEGKVTPFYDNIDMKSCWSGNGFVFLVDNRTNNKKFNLTLTFKLTGLRIDGLNEGQKADENTV
jgi:hypothetical protein